jgi:L-alanine-DL-glutamate epimerase-like enolase superfamily enzyme
VPVVRSIDGVPLLVPLVDPFVIANARLDTVRNLAVRVVLDDGTEGWGEVGTLPPITAESYDDAVAAVQSVAGWLPGLDPEDSAGIAERLAAALPRWAATRAGIEQACWDAVARSRGVPLWRRFGDARAEVVTDITVPICTVERAAELGALWLSRGFSTIKLKVGGDFDADLARIDAIGSTHPTAGLVLDANEGWSVEQTLEAVARVTRSRMHVVLLEQPVPRADLDGLARLTREAGAPVAADEACKSAADVERIGRERLASVVNVKIAKCGVHEAVRMMDAARRHGLGLMIGAMVETRIGTGFSAHVVAGRGGFLVVDLDTPWLMTADPVEGGPVLDGPRWRIDDAVPGHGARPRANP